MLSVPQEETLLGILRQAENHAYALAHSYDIGGQPDRAYGFVALGERLRETAIDVSGLVRPLEPHSITPVLGLRSRAFSLRRLLRGTAWQGPSWRLSCLGWPANSLQKMSRREERCVLCFRGRDRCVVRAECR